MSFAGSPFAAMQASQFPDFSDYVMESYESSECSPGLAFCQQPADSGPSFNWQFQQYPPVVTVKNTFIDGWAEEVSDEQGVPMVSAKSCPAPKSHVFLDDDEEPPPRYACLLGRLPADAPAKAHQLAVQYLPNPSPDAMPAYVWPQRLAEELRPSEHGATLEMNPAVVEQVRPAASRPLPPHVTPLDRRGPETSLGSVDHENGDCRPCAWFWRPQGCNNGQDCRHCHLCDQGEVKLRRKSKLGALRKQGRGGQRAASKEGSAASAEVPEEGVRPLKLTNLV